LYDLRSWIFSGNNDRRENFLDYVAIKLHNCTLAEEDHLEITFPNVNDAKIFLVQCEKLKLSTCLDEFEPISTIGKGRWGKVIVCSRYQQLFAVKEIETSRSSRLKHVQDERLVLGMIPTHPFVIQMRFAIQKKSFSYIVMDFEPGGNLRNILRNYTFPKSTAVLYASQVLLAIQHLHNARVIHRDIKPENILLDVKGYLKLSDFGLAKCLMKGGGTNTFCGSDPYISPEMLQGHSYSYSVDVWQFGCFVFELFTGCSPFYHPRWTKQQLRSLIKRCAFRFPLRFPLRAKWLVKNILTTEPNSRLGCGSDQWEEIKRNSFFLDLDWDCIYLQNFNPPIHTVKLGINILENFEDIHRSENCDFQDDSLESEISSDMLLGFDYTQEFPQVIQNTELRKTRILCPHNSNSDGSTLI